MKRTLVLLTSLALLLLLTGCGKDAPPAASSAGADRIKGVYPCAKQKVNSE